MAPRKKATNPSQATQAKKKSSTESSSTAPRTTPSVPKSTKRKTSADQSRPSKKSKTYDDGEEEIPRLPNVPYKEARSMSARSKTAFKISRASLMEDDLNEESIAKLFKDIKPTSLTNLTWGETSNGGTKAILGRRRRKWNIQRVKSTGTDQDRYMQMTGKEVGRGDLRYDGLIHNPRDSFLLRWPYEIREGIYEYFLISNDKIRLKPDLTTVEMKIVADHAIRRTCRTLYTEGTAFLFKRNMITVVFRNMSRAAILRIYHIVSLPANFASMFRNVTLEFYSDCWKKSWYEKAKQCVETITDAGAHLSCLTLMLNPKEIKRSTRYAGLKAARVSFGDFLDFDRDLMVAIRELHPRNLKLVIQKAVKKRLTVELDLTYADALWRQSEEFMNECTEKILVIRGEQIDSEMQQLRDRFEYIFRNDVLATRHGHCTSNVPVPAIETPQRSHSLKGEDFGEDNAMERGAGILYIDDPQQISTDIEEETDIETGEEDSGDGDEA